MFARSNFAFGAIPFVVAAACVTLLLLAAHAADAALATQAGFRQMTVTASSADAKPAHFALYYPTLDAARVIPIGTFPQTAAINGASAPKVKGPIVISHDTASTETGYVTVALALARKGNLVASVEHVGDTWQDQSMRATPGRYFPERPRQASRVIDIATDPNPTLMCTRT
jgi:predicted dienelactone hydrolase